MTAKQAIKTLYQNEIKDIRDKIKIEKAFSFYLKHLNSLS